MEYIAELQDSKYYYEPWNEGQGQENKYMYNGLDSLYNKLFDKWRIEFEKCCDDVRATIEGLLLSEYDYYTSEEYARLECEDELINGGEYRYTDKSGRVYYSDHRRWYTTTGELFMYSNVDHECISITCTR